MCAPPALNEKWISDMTLISIWGISNRIFTFVHEIVSLNREEKQQWKFREKKNRERELGLESTGKPTIPLSKETLFTPLVKLTVLSRVKLLRLWAPCADPKENNQRSQRKNYQKENREGFATSFPCLIYDPGSTKRRENTKLTYKISIYKRMQNVSPGIHTECSLRVWRIMLEPALMAQRKKVGSKISRHMITWISYIDPTVIFHRNYLHFSCGLLPQSVPKVIRFVLCCSDLL